MTMISAIFAAISQAITGFLTCVSGAVSGVTDMFYISSGDNAGLTVLGTLLLIAVGTGLVFWGFRLIKGLVKRA